MQKEKTEVEQLARALDVLTNLEPQADIHTENKRREKLIDIITPKREQKKKVYLSCSLII